MSLQICDVTFNSPYLTSSRLLMRPLHAGDVAAVAQLVSVATWPGFEGSATYQAADAMRHVAWCQNQWQCKQPDALHFALILRRQMPLVGLLALHDCDWDLGRAQLGIVLSNFARGRGLAHEACCAVMHHAKTAWQLRSLRWVHETNNPASARLARRLGFALCASPDQHQAYEKKLIKIDALI